MEKRSIERCLPRAKTTCGTTCHTTQAAAHIDLTVFVRLILLIIANLKTLLKLSPSAKKSEIFLQHFRPNYFGFHRRSAPL